MDVSAVLESTVVVAAAVVEVPRATVVVEAPGNREGDVVVAPTVVVLEVLVAAGLTSPEMRIASPCRAEDGSITTDAADASSARAHQRTQR